MAYKYRPKTKEELVEAIKKEIYEVQGTFDNPNWKADLNCIDTSLITDMSELFSEEYGLKEFNGDISKWNVSNVINMKAMFYGSKFNGNISNWNISNVENMNWMFSKASFNQDISKWDVSNVKSMYNMFAHSKFNQDISNWEIKTEKIMNIFWSSDFNKDIGLWPEELRKLSGLKNISNSVIFSRLPDKIIYPETIVNIFTRSVKNPDDTFNINNFKKIFKNYLNNKKKIYEQKKKYPKHIINKLVLNDIADILKYLKDKDIQKKFMKITMNKDSKEPDIEIS